MNVGVKGGVYLSHGEGPGGLAVTGLADSDDFMSIKTELKWSPMEAKWSPMELKRSSNGSAASSKNDFWLIYFFVVWSPQWISQWILIVSLAFQ